MNSNEPFRGIFTIPSTSFKKNGEVDVPSFRRVVDFCVECGAHGLVYPVNASEFYALSHKERYKMAEILIDQNSGRIPVIIGVAGSSKEVAANFAKHAKDIGADGVIAMPPYVHRSKDEKPIFDYYKRISDVAQIPVFVQNNSGLIGTVMSPKFFLKLCREIEFVEYVKEETVPSTIKTTAIIKGNDGSCKGVFGGHGGRYLLEEYRRGMCGQMPGCHVTDVVVALWNALEKGNREKAIYIYKEMSPLFFFESQTPGTYKEVLYRRGVIDCPIRRNVTSTIDEIASQYLDEILESLKPLMTWK